MKQGSLEWIAHRRNFIGASDAPIIMGVSSWRTLFQLWQEKLGLNEGQKENRAMIYGKRMEKIARQAYENYTGNIVSIEEKDTLVYHPEKKFMMASLDGFVIDKFIPLEIKTANAEDHFLAKNGRIPAKYYPQVQHQLTCVEDSDLLHYFSYRRGDIALVEVEKNFAYIDELYFEEARFWDMVLNLEAPELTDKDYVLFEDQEWDSLATKWRKVITSLSVLEKKEKEYRAALIARAAG
ncbi:MAG: lambda-exonuclease family protein, partial [Candidatus Rhabdochlamydia sp.]